MVQGLFARFVDTSVRLESEVRRAEALPRGSLERSDAIACLARRFVAFGVAEERLLFQPIEKAGRRLPEPVPALLHDQRRLVHRALELGEDPVADWDVAFMEELEAHLDDERNRLLPEIEAWMACEHVTPAPVWYADELLARYGECTDCCAEQWLG